MAANGNEFVTLSQLNDFNKYLGVPKFSATKNSSDSYSVLASSELIVDGSLFCLISFPEEIDLGVTYPVNIVVLDESGEDQLIKAPIVSHCEASDKLNVTIVSNVFYPFMINGANGSAWILGYGLDLASENNPGLMSSEDKVKLDNLSSVLAIANGGTGMTESPSMLTNLASGAAADVLQADPRPGVTGVLPVANGGTGTDSLTGGQGLIHDLFSTANEDEFFATFSSGWSSGGYLSKQALLNMIYPVGSVYMSWRSTSPASFFGGSWTQIIGRFPYFTNNTEPGGSNTHTLTASQMPSHTHTPYQNLDVGGVGFWASNASTGTAWKILTRESTGADFGLFNKNTGGGSSHNNMPLYQGMYAWRRTA